MATATATATTAQWLLPSQWPEPEMTHAVHGLPLAPPFPERSGLAVFGMGCFWGAERRFWQSPGVLLTAVGYAGGHTPQPDYHEVCAGQSGHAEVVLVVHDPQRISYEALLRSFWEGHDPTQGMRQGNDIGSQYRSIVLCDSAWQKTAALTARKRYQESLRTAGYGDITTEISAAAPFHYAEPYHQQYLHKNLGGHCGLGGTGVPYPKAPAP